MKLWSTAVVRKSTWSWIYEHREDIASLGLREVDADTRVLLEAENNASFVAMLLTGPYVGQYARFTRFELRPLSPLEQLAECAE